MASEIDVERQELMGATVTDSLRRSAAGSPAWVQAWDELDAEAPRFANDLTRKGMRLLSVWPCLIDEQDLASPSAR